MIRGVRAGRAGGDVIGRRHKIYVAFTVEQVVKCNYRGGRHTAEPQPSRQTGRKARRQVIKAHSSTLSLRLSLLLLPLFICLSLSSSGPINQLQQVQAAVKTAEASDTKCFMGTMRRGRRLTGRHPPQKDKNREESGPVTEDKLHILNLSSFFLHRMFVTLQEKKKIPSSVCWFLCLNACESFCKFFLSYTQVLYCWSTLSLVGQILTHFKGEHNQDYFPMCLCQRDNWRLFFKSDQYSWSVGLPHSVNDRPLKANKTHLFHFRV